MDSITRSIAAARRRIVVQTWLDATAWAVLAAVLAFAALLVLERAVLVSATPMAVWYTLAALVLLVPIIYAVAVRPNAAAAAAVVDDRLKLKDRLGTALYARRLKDDPFAQQALADAQAAAAQLRLSRALPLRWHKAWGWAPPLIGVAALLWAMLPEMDVAGLKAAQKRRDMQAIAAQADREQLAKAVQAAQKINVSDDTGGEADPLDALKQLATLTERDLRNPDMRREAAARLSSAQERLSQAARQKEEQIKPLQNAMSRLDNDKPGPADQFAQALQRGDFAAAQQALKELSEQIDSMDDAQKETLKQQLENLSQQLAQMQQQMQQQQQAAQQQAQQAQQQQQAAQQQMQQTAQQAGLSQQQVQQYQSGQMSQQQLQQQIQQNLPQQGMSQQQAQQQAQQMAQQMQQAQQQQQQAQQQQQQAQQQQQGSGQCQQCAGGLSSSLNQMAQSLNQQQGQQSQQFQSQSYGAQQQLSQLAQMQQQMQQYQQAQQQMQQAQQQMNNSGGSQQNSPFQPNPFAQGNSGNSGGGVGGSRAGKGDGGNPMGGERTLSNYNTEAKNDSGDGQGRVIASWLQKGEVAKGESTVAFDQAVTEARQDAEQAVTEDRVPRRYHGAIKDYFNQLPQTPEQVQEKRPPRAPR